MTHPVDPRADADTPPPADLTPDTMVSLGDVLRMMQQAQNGGVPTPPPDGDAWAQQHLATTPRGEYKGTGANVAKVLLDHPDWLDVLALNERSGVIEFNKPAPFADQYTEAAQRRPGFRWRPHALTDADDTRISIWFSDVLGIDLKGTMSIHAGVQVAAERNAHDPFERWLGSLEHDGTGRLDTWAIDYLGAADTPLTRVVCRKWLVSAVARTMRPGCKADHMLVLEGGQGLGKSTALSVLAGEDYFSDALESFSGKDAAMGLQGCVIVEVGELAGFKRTEVEEIKGFISRDTDRFRPPYGRRTVEVKRRCVLAGTTNASDYLRDDTGGRRFWPVACGETGPADLAGLREVRDQLWAEALAAFKAGETWHLEDAEHIEAAREAVEERHPGDVWEDAVHKYLGTLSRTQIAEGVSSAQIADELEIPTGQQSTLTALRLGGIMRRAGWTMSRVRRMDGTRPRVWTPAEGERLIGGGNAGPDGPVQETAGGPEVVQRKTARSLIQPPAGPLDHRSHPTLGVVGGSPSHTDGSKTRSKPVQAPPGLNPDDECPF